MPIVANFSSSRTQIGQLGSTSGPIVSSGRPHSGQFGSKFHPIWNPGQCAAPGILTKNLTRRICVATGSYFDFSIFCQVVNTIGTSPLQALVFYAASYVFFRLMSHPLLHSVPQHRLVQCTSR